MIKKQKMTRVVENVEDVRWCSHYGEEYEVSSQKVKTKMAI